MALKGEFLPMSRQDMARRGWTACDFIIVSGDAYVDHASFGSALIGRYLESLGYRVGIIAQPRWDGVGDFQVLGCPELAFLITAGNMDSLVNHYTVAGKKRSRDSYSPGGRPGRRPDRASIVYTSRVRQAWKGVPVILGGIEASLRRLAHYDYWSGKVRRSLLLDAKADMIIYGMAERPLREVAAALAAGRSVKSLAGIRGTVTAVSERRLAELDPSGDCIRLPAWDMVRNDKKAYAESFLQQYLNTSPYSAQGLLEPYGDRIVIQNPPAYPLTEAELDGLYGLPFTRRAHPGYDSDGGIPALEEVRFSLTANRGCLGGCSFCALTFHQGREIRTRSPQSLVGEARTLTQDPGFKGYIHDVGGPTANFYHPACNKQAKEGVCLRRNCLVPEPCPNLDSSHSRYLKLLEELRGIPGIKKVFIRSGIRFDYLLAGGNEAFLEALCRHHVSGQLKLAPEHADPRVLALMNKPPVAVYQDFKKRFNAINKRLGKKQYIIPYFISSHPGSGLKEAIALALFLRAEGFIPDQVQDFYPTPGTLSTAMYYTGLDPRSMEAVYVPRDPAEKRMQRALLHFHKKENHSLVRKALRKVGRGDLIGKGRRFLVPPGP